MSYDRRRDRRNHSRERSLMGETLAQFHERENPSPTAPGAGIPHVRCTRTPSLFEGDGHDDPADFMPAPLQGRLF